MKLSLIEKVTVATWKGGKICKRCQARENMQRVPSAEKHVTGAKRGKTCNRCQARENMQPVPSAGKHAAGTKRGKQAMVPSAGKCVKAESRSIAVYILEIAQINDLT